MKGSTTAAIAVAVLVALVVAACGGGSRPGGGSQAVGEAGVAGAVGGDGSRAAGAGGAATIPKAHPRVVQPTAGTHVSGSSTSASGSAASDPVGDPTAHAQPLADVKRELAKLNLCGGATDPAQATPFQTGHGFGFVADPGTVQNVGELPVITQDLNALGIALHLTIFGISGYRTPAHSVAVGGFADDPHTKGEAEDIGVNSLLRSSAAQISEAQLARFGLYRPFDPTDDPNNTEVNHVQLIPRGGPVPLTVVQDTFAPDPSCT